MRKQFIHILASFSVLLLGISYVLANNVSADGKRVVAYSEKILESPPIDIDASDGKVRRDPPSSILSVDQSELDWKITNWNRSTLQKQATSWVNNHYQLAKVFGNPDSDVFAVSTPKSSLALKELIEFEVVDVPQSKGGLKSEFRQKEQKDKLIFYAMVVFEDKDRYLYTAFLESREFNSNVLLVTSVGPAIDRNPLKQNLTLKQRHLRSDSSNYISNSISTRNGRLVVIPYPYAMEQVYVQYGSSPFAANFEQLETGRKYENLDEILEETDKQWKDVNPQAIQ